MIIKPKISVLMSVYNTDFLIVKRAIDSVLNQDFQDFELIIIDDGSQNLSQNKLVHYAEEHEDKISYIRHSNRGQSRSINRGIFNSSGDFITIIDADDEYKPYHLRYCLNEIQFMDLIASTTETVVDDDEDYYVPNKYDQSQLIHVDDCILFATLFGRREVFTNLRFESGFASDADFYERASKQFRVKKVNLKTYIYYRNNSNSICATVKKQNLALLS